MNLKSTGEGAYSRHLRLVHTKAPVSRFDLVVHHPYEGLGLCLARRYLCGPVKGKCNKEVEALRLVHIVVTKDNCFKNWHVLLNPPSVHATSTREEFSSSFRRFCVTLTTTPLFFTFFHAREIRTQHLGEPKGPEVAS